MNRYEIENAARSIEGYFIPRPNESSRDAFNRAQKETAEAYKKMLKNVEEMSFEQYQSALKKTG